MIKPASMPLSLSSASLGGLRSRTVAVMCGARSDGCVRWPLALDVERAFHPRNISTKQTNDRGDNPMKAIVVTDQAAGTAGMTLVVRPEPQAAINDVIVQVHASGFV